MRRRAIALLLSLVVLAPLAMSPAGAAWTAGRGEALAVTGIHTGPDYNEGRLLPVVSPESDRFELFSSSATTRNQIGDRRKWFALDDAKDEIYLKTFVLRGKGDRVEVWVTPNLSFPGQDCRNDERIKVRRRQVRRLVRQFDDNIFPKESRWFSRPPRRNGRNGLAPAFTNLGRRYFRGNGRKIVVLVDNVRDDNYYDANNSQNLPYIIGFFYSQFVELTDRNVMTIDGFDWLHRTTANPPHEPIPNDSCNSKPARPFLIEETFAHEYQHLLHYYEDPNERTWLNEGLSDWAQTLTGYAHPGRSIDERGFDRHVQCFLGWCSQPTDFNPSPVDMGAENSLTVWSDQGAGEILADYGATYTFMELLASRYGRPFMRLLHRNNRNGLASLSRMLTKIGANTDPRSVIDDWAAMVALDGRLDLGAALTGADPSSLRARRLHASVNWSTAHSFSTPGAPPNGSDYVRVRAQNGSFLTAAELESLSFEDLAGAPEGAFTVQLVAYDDAGTAAWIARVPLDADNSGALTGAQLQELLGTWAETVGAIVTIHDPGEFVRSYTPYRLVVNGVTQPGGS